MDYRKEKEAFLAYANRYDRSNGMIELKVVHTLRVVSVMDAVTEALDLSDESRYLASLCALFHDIGRFEQVKRYGTFNDRLSVDHAELSCEVLRENRFLDHLTDRQKTMVLTAIANHNRLYIEDGLDPETLLYAKLIRDADKTDIFRVFSEEEMVNTMGETIEEIEQERISDEVYECFMSHKCIPRAIRRTGLDIWTGFLGFFFDMNFPESVAIARREGYYRKQFDKTNFALPETRERVRTMLTELENYLDTYSV